MSTDMAIRSSRCRASARPPAGAASGLSGPRLGLAYHSHCAAHIQPAAPPSRSSPSSNCTAPPRRGKSREEAEMDADGSPKRSRPGRRPTKKLKFKPKVPPLKPKKSPPEKPQNDEPKPIDEALMNILRTHQVTEKTYPNTKDELLTRKSPSTPPSAAAANLSSSAVHKQNESKALQIPRVFPIPVNRGMLYKENDDDDDDDDDDSDDADNDNDGAKFQESQLSSTECEASIRPAEELKLLEQDGKERMFLFQLPKSLPLPKRSSVVKGKGKATGKEVKEGFNLQQLPQGYLGKMLVYKSGKIKMKLGDVMFDVNPGAECSMVQHAVALNTREKHCCMLGEIENRHVIVAPDVDSLLNRR